jgi:diaminopimelate epimerase
MLDVKPSNGYPSAMKARRMNGAGNRFILADLRGRAGLVSPAVDQVRRWAGEFQFDQLLVLEDADGADAFMRIWNADGDEVGDCGNGTRAAAQAMMQHVALDRVVIGTVGGLLHADTADNGQIRVDMGEPRLNWQNIPLAREMDTVQLDFAAEAAGVRVENPGAVNLGNPHAVFFVRDVETLPLAALGREIEMDPVFPERVNASFAQIFDASHIRLRVWERGAGITAACGTAACATLVAAHRRGLAARSTSIMADGGELHVEWREHDNHVILTGPVEDEGEVDIQL